MHSMGTEAEVDETIVKNTRPLIEVEVETQYPIFPSKVQFRILKAQDKRDGYMELKCSEENVVNVSMKRIDSSIQVAPAFVSTEAQTICTYPKNAATEYLYDVGKQDELPPEYQQQIIRYANDNLENIGDLLRVNGVINLYANDFDSLLMNSASIDNHETYSRDYEEYMFFLDVELCKGKMISDIYWHQMWTGTIAIAYADFAPNIFYTSHNKDDRVFKAVHGVNPVLIWSIKDCLKPKLILESPREIQRLSFCKFDENVLIGGCRNGQIIDVSPFRSLHLNWKPIYRINVNRKSNRNKPVMITRCASSFCSLKYEEVNPVKGKSSFKERLIYRPVYQCTKTLDDIKPVLQIGTVDGNVSTVTWEGQDFDSGEVVNSEQAKFIYDGRYHDGPINWLQMTTVLNVTLSVGGKIFALWRSDLPQRPILWRRSRHMYTKGDFNIFQPFQIVLLTMNGVLQKWILHTNSKEPLFNQVMSNGFLTTSALHPFALKRNIFGLGDEQGAFRLFSIPESNIKRSENMTSEMRNFLDREIKRKTLFYKWQDEFNKKNEHFLKMRQEAEEKAKHDKEAEVEKSDDKDIEKVIPKGPQPGKYIEWVKEQRQLSEQARIKAMIINKKQLDTKELEKRRKPLQKLDEENERKKRKQKQRLKEGENIFRETVASLFPDVLKEKPIPPPDPYVTSYDSDFKQSTMDDYEILADEASDFISNNPYHYDFSYKTLLVGNRKKFQQDLNYIHKQRHENEKYSKNQSEFTKEEDPDDVDLDEVEGDTETGVYEM
ncbi:hypothetical protein GWI33_000387 [Rhynchophorus ferrugineus]|uniref:Uncharacterized protein n=1 Tax=Rhynchophorus ferrugineus TaxID=354439 RepID=A0A834IP00_RHYFE|nr:hypothetical protein GWI33_000387 [Rhynchophorus ferrugineus]